MTQQPHPHAQQTQQQKQQQLIQLQGSLVNKLTKRIFPDKIITSDFKKQFSKALSIFILYVQSGQAKKKYTKDDIMQFLEREGLGKIADDLRKDRICKDEVVSRKKLSKDNQQQVK